MAATKTRKTAKMATRSLDAANAVKVADTNLYTPVDALGRRIYCGVGLALTEAVRLAQSMFAPAGVARLEADGSLTAGSVSFCGEVPVFAAGA